MQIVGGRRFAEIPGDWVLELPPLLIRALPHPRRMEKVVEMATEIIESEDLLPCAGFEERPAGRPHSAAGGSGAHRWNQSTVKPSLTQEPAGSRELERRRFDLAIGMVDQYLSLLDHWKWGDSILEWIRQCEITFERRSELRLLLHPDVWPHAGRSSFVTLLEDKAVPTDGVAIDKAVGLRLTFRHPPPISCFSNQFLFYLNSTVASSAYQKWATMSPEPVSSLPPERFEFQVVAM